MTQPSTRPAATPDRSLREAALVGLGGAVLSGIGDVLILGRPVSGPDFDTGGGLVPAPLRHDRWRSLWNGAVLPRRRVHAGTLVGLVGIAALQHAALRTVAQVVEPASLRRVASVSATVFAVAGSLTHLCCGAVILAYQDAGSAPAPPPAPAAAHAGEVGRPATSAGPPAAAPKVLTALLGASAAATLGSLAVLSGALTADRAARRTRRGPVWISTPLPWVLATLSTFGRLPAPLGGYLRPASISVGLLAYFAARAVAAVPTAAGSADGRRR